MSSGLKIAAYYSLPSFSLGFCGPQDKTSRKTLYNFAVGKPVSENSVREIFKTFEAAYSYYKLIASKNNITDPLDKQIVKAFWVGNSLLEKVTGNDLKKMILTEFTKPGLLSQEEVSKKVKKIPLAAKPHHSFHVLFLGSVTKRVSLEGVMLDLCRIGWGRVKKVTSNKLQVTSKPLILGEKMKLGEETQREIGWNEKIVPKVKIGDWVSFHWAQACEVLTREDIKNLEFYTQETIDLINLKEP